MPRKPRQDFTGFSNNRLTLIRPSGVKGTKKYWWWAVCNCDPGNPDFNVTDREILVDPYRVVKGVWKSCGCLRAEKAVLKWRTKWRNHLARWDKIKKHCESMSEETKNFLTILGKGNIVRGSRSLLWYFTKEKYYNNPPAYKLEKS